MPTDDAGSVAILKQELLFPASTLETGAAPGTVRPSRKGLPHIRARFCPHTNEIVIEALGGKVAKNALEPFEVFFHDEIGNDRGIDRIATVMEAAALSSGFLGLLSIFVHVRPHGRRACRYWLNRLAHGRSPALEERSRERERKRELERLAEEGKQP